MISDEPTSTDEPDTEPPGTDESEYESEEEGSGEEGNNGIDCNDWCLPNKKTKPHDFRKLSVLHFRFFLIGLFTVFTTYTE